MTPAPSKRVRRDRDCGLTFSWRLPVAHSGNMIAAVVITAALALVLSSVVQIQVHGALRRPERRGSLVMLESDSPEGRALTALALEAGPFPDRSKLGNDPALISLMAQAESGRMPPGTLYRPEWQEIPVSRGKPTDKAKLAIMLPPLPEPETSVSPEGPERRRLRVVSLNAGTRIAADEAPENLREGTRFLVRYDGQGLVVQVSSLGDDSSASIESWLGSAKIEGGDKNGGWLPVEVRP